MNRSDGRSENSLRPLGCELSTLSDAHGSAVWQSGGTSVLASCRLTAPRQAQTLADNANNALSTYENGALVQVLLPGSLRNGSEWEVFLVNVLTACIRKEACPPMSMIQIVIQVPSDDGSVLSACVHASVSAMMDASIELNYLPVAVTCMILSGAASATDDGDGRKGAETKLFGLDPTLLEEEQDGSGLLTLVVVQGKSDQSAGMGAMHSSGITASAQDLLKCWSMAQKASSAVTSFWRLALTHKHERHHQTLFAGAPS